MSSEMLDIAYYAALVAAGIGSGFAGGLFGIGGGLLRVPILLYLFPAFGVADESVFHLAAGTSLAVAIPTSIASAGRQYKAGNLNFAFLRTWIPWLLVGVGVGVGASYICSGRILTASFIGLLVVMAIYFALPSRPHVANEVPGGILRALMAMFIGAFSTVLGLSGGVLTTPSLVACRETMHRAVAISSAGSLAISIVATAGMVWSGIGVAGLPTWSWGYVDLPALGIMTPTVMLMAPLGVGLANRLSARKLELAFCVLLIVLGADLTFKLVG